MILLPKAALTTPPKRLTPAPIIPPTPGIFEAREPTVCMALPTPVLFFPASNPPIAVAAVLAIPPKPPALTPNPLSPFPKPEFIKLLVALVFAVPKLPSKPPIKYFLFKGISPSILKDSPGTKDS